MATGPKFIVVDEKCQFSVFELCANETCGLYHGPVATSKKAYDAARIARALERILPAASSLQDTENENG